MKLFMSYPYTMIQTVVNIYIINEPNSREMVIGSDVLCKEMGEHRWG